MTLKSIPRDIKVNRSENRSRSENQSNRYSWMMSIMRRLNEKGTTLALNILNSDRGEIMKVFRFLKLLISVLKINWEMIRCFFVTSI